MRIEVLYDDGRLGVFDTGNQVASQPWGGANIATELLLRADDMSDGLVLEIHHHDAVIESNGDETPDADRYRGCGVCLAEPDDLDRVMSVVVDGKVAMWSQGGALVDGLRFEWACRLWYSGVPYACDNYKACELYAYLEAARPDLRGDPSAICALFGYPLAAYRDARQAESRQPSEACDGEEA